MCFWAHLKNTMIQIPGHVKKPTLHIERLAKNTKPTG